MQLHILHSTFRHKRIERTKQAEILQIFQKACESHTDLQSYVSRGRAVGSCLHAMTRPRVADGGTASSIEGSCEYIELVVAVSRHGAILQLGGWARC